MISVIRSHHLTILAKRLAEALERSAPDDPLRPQAIIVPNLDTARWLKLFLAGENGISGNLECMLPAEWQWKQVRKLYPDLSGVLPSDQQPMKWSLFKLLTDSGICSEFPVLEKYVSNQPEETKERAVLQLAGQIASVFDQYLIYRPEMILSWQKGRRGKGDERWQSGLWRELDKIWKASGPGSLNKAELFQKTHNAFKKGTIKTAEHLFVFNAGLIPLPIVSMLKEAGRESEITVFHVQPSKTLDENQNELFQSLGAEARNMHKMVQLLEGTIEEEFSAEFPHTLLGFVQRSIAEGTSLRAIENEWKQHNIDIEIRSCHSPLREMETLYQFLLERFEADETLNPDDVLVVTPDPETFKPFIRAVFKNPDEGQPDIPFHLSSSPSASSGFRQALHQLMQVVDSRFTFSQVMDLFQSEAVRETFSLSDSSVSMVREWMQDNHVIWGLDEDHRQEWGQPRDSFQTWRSALKSGWLGHMISGENGIAGDDTLLYNGITSTSESEIWAAFSGFLNRLDQMRVQAKQKRTAADWSKWLDWWLPRFFFG
jgi:exodeoxyribonuclease V gamma subunit